MVRHEEGHFSHRIGLLRAMVLGANDGIISTACLILGVAAADGTRNAIITAGVAGLVAGAASMAIGEFVSVSSQRDAEQADIAKETWELEHTPEHELDELTAIYKGKGLTQELARAVAVQLTKEDALKVHMAEELGITHLTLARPVQASVSSLDLFRLVQQSHSLLLLLQRHLSASLQPLWLLCWRLSRLESRVQKPVEHIHCDRRSVWFLVVWWRWHSPWPSVGLWVQ